MMIMNSACKCYSIIDFGAKDGGDALNTVAVQEAIDTCAMNGGGIVTIPAGQFLISTINMRSNVTLHLGHGAVLCGSTNPDDFTKDSANSTNTIGLINANECENICIQGEGCIDGQGEIFWKRHFEWREKQKSKSIDPAVEGEESPLRPGLIRWVKCRNVTLRGIHVKNSPRWTIHFLACEDVAVQDVHINNPHNSVNTDGINPESCRNVQISGCHISTGDDAITIKAGYEGHTLGPCENVTISDCIIETAHCGVGIGSEMSGGVRNIAINNCIFDGTYRGIRVKTRRGRGGMVENITAGNMIMYNVFFPIFIDTFYYDSNRDIKPVPKVSESTPKILHLQFHNLKTSGAVKAGHIVGLPEGPIRDISFKNILIQSETGVICKDVNEISFRNSQIVVEKDSPQILFENVKNLNCDSNLKAKKSTVDNDEGQYTDPVLFEKMKKNQCKNQEIE